MHDYITPRQAQAIANTSAVNPGTVFTIKKTVLQSDIVAAGIDLTLVSSGLLELIDLRIQNGATAFDSATDTAVLEVYTNNVRGSVPFLTVAQALLIANSLLTGIMATTMIGYPVLESGKKITINATGEDFISAGNTDIYLTFRRAAAGATIAAA